MNEYRSRASESPAARLMERKKKKKKKKEKKRDSNSDTYRESISGVCVLSRVFRR
jgi:hypothetical protein